MNTISNSDLAEAKLTGYYIDRAIQFIVTSEGLEDNMPGDFSEMMIFLYNARDIFYMYANGTEGKDTRKLIDELYQNPILEEINDAKKFMFFMDRAIQYIVTSEELKINFPGDFDMMMLHLFKSRSFFEKLAESKNDKAVLAMVADQPDDAPDDVDNANLPVFDFYVPKSLNMTIPVNVLILNNWPEDIAKKELLNFLQQLHGYYQEYYVGEDLLEVYSPDKIGGTGVIGVESAGLELIERLFTNLKANQILVFTTNLKESVLSEFFRVKPEDTVILLQPHTIKVSFQN